MMTRLSRSSEKSRVAWVERGFSTTGARLGAGAAAADAMGCWAGAAWGAMG